MKILFIILFLSILAMTLVSSAINPFPTKMYLDIKPNTEMCKNIRLTSQDYTGEIKIRSVWASSINDPFNTNKFNANQNDLGIEVNHIKKINDFDGDENIELCVKTNKDIKAKGAIIFTPESETNVVVEVGSWIFINLHQEEVKSLEIIEDVSEEKEEDLGLVKYENKETEKDSSITGAAVVIDKEEGNSWMLIIGIAIVAFILGLLISKRGRKNEY